MLNQLGGSKTQAISNSHDVTDQNKNKRTFAGGRFKKPLFDDSETNLEDKMSDQEAKEPAAAAKKTCLFKRAVKRPGGGAANRRQRQRSPSKSGSSDSDSSDSSSGETQVFKREKKSRGGLTQSSSKFKKVRKQKQESSSEDDEKGSSVNVAFKGTGLDKTGPSDGGATAVNQLETAQDHDARAIFERSQATNDARKDSGQVDFDDKVYRGANNYAKFLEKKDTAGGSAAKMSTGPQRAPANIRSTVR